MREIIQDTASRKLQENNYRGVINVCPRVGKSKIILDSLRHKQSKILVSVPLNDIIDSWKAEIQKWGGGSNTFKIVNKRNLNDEDLKWADHVVCDEIHDLSDNQRQTLAPYSDKIIGLSGSINEFTELNLYSSFGLVPIYTYTIEQGIKDGIISNFEIKVVTCQLSMTDKVTVTTKQKKYSQTEHQRYISLTALYEQARRAAWENPRKNNWKMACAGKRSNFLYTCPSKVNIAKKIVDSVDRCLIFTTRISVARKLADAHTSKDFGNYERFVNGEIDKLAVAQKLSMGVTIPNLKIGVFHQIQSNNESAVQKVLRMCNLEDDRVAQIYICMYTNTVDEMWVRKALKLFPKSKISYLDHRSL